MSNNLSNLKLTETPNLVVEQRAPAIDFSRANKDDFVNQLDQLTKKLQNDHQSQASSLKISDLDLSVRPSTAFDDPVERALREAKELIEANRFQAALEPLGRALREEPNHPEATFLLAYCYFNLEQIEQAMITLLSLRHQRLDNNLAPRVQALKIRIRNSMMLMVLLENAILLRAGKLNVAMERLARLIQLDPEAELYHFLMGGSLMMAGRLDQASQAVQVGIRECRESGTEMLESLQSQIMDRKAAQHLVPVRDQVKKNKIDKAQNKMRELPGDVKNTELYRQFEKYLRGSARGSLSYGSSRPSADGHKEMEAFHFFLVGDEIRDAGNLMDRQKFQDAEKVLAKAVTLAPQFPYLHYLYAGCIFTGLVVQLGARRKPSQDKIDEALKLAHSHAMIGTADPEIEEAPMLADIIGRTMDSRREGERLSGLFEEFQAIMNGTKKGIRTPQQLNEVYQKVNALRENIKRTRATIENPDVLGQLDMLAEAVERNYQQLVEMRAGLQEVEVVNEFGRRFMEHMEGIKRRGGLNSWERDDERRYFENLRSEVQQAMLTLSSREVRQQMANLIETIDQILRQL